MSLFQRILRRLFGNPIPPPTPRARRKGKAKRAPAAQAEAPEEPAEENPGRPGNLDGLEGASARISAAEDEILARIGARIEGGNFELPQLPSTSVAALEVCNRPSAEIASLVDLIASDPVLSGELLKVANSALYTVHIPAATVRDAVMRVGLRAMRGLVFSVSMRSVILRSGLVAKYAEEVWRQAVSVAVTAREVAPVLGLEAERAYMLGLLHDIGKVALLPLLREEVQSAGDISSALVGRVFSTHHEAAGASMARQWKLPDEIRSVAGCHHAFEENEEHREAAAFANLVHRLDLHLSLRDDHGFRALAESPMMELLDPEGTARWKVLELAERAFIKANGRGRLAAA